MIKKEQMKQMMVMKKARRKMTPHPVHQRLREEARATTKIMAASTMLRMAKWNKSYANF
jgi:hypothetical protein